MTNIGIVKSVQGNIARVIVVEGPGCCESCRTVSCDPISGTETEAINFVHAKVGQKVRINMKVLTFLTEVLLLYVLPIVALLTGAVLGRSYLPGIFQGDKPRHTLCNRRVFPVPDLFADGQTFFPENGEKKRQNTNLSSNR